MNRENLLLMAKYIENIPQEKFSMFHYRKDKNNLPPECNTIGCIIGHCTVLDNQDNINASRNFRGDIDFSHWSENFTGIIVSTDVWRYLFSSDWVDVDNTPTGASNRILHFLENGLPIDWESEMYGEAYLSY